MVATMTKFGKAIPPREVLPKSLTPAEYADDPRLRWQPINLLTWRPVEILHANAYNPNRVAPPELGLLKVSILEDGWTQPVVIRPRSDDDEFEIVDGFHRTSLVRTDRDVYDMTGGLVPTVLLTPAIADQMLSTIRHNRARGTHHVVRMAEIVAELLEAHDLSEAELRARLGMDDEEIRRLAERGKMTARGSRPDGSFGRGWVPGDGGEA